MSLLNLKTTSLGNATGIGIDFTPDSIATLSIERNHGHLHIADILFFDYNHEADDLQLRLPRELRHYMRDHKISTAGISSSTLASNESIHSLPASLPASALENFVQVQVRSLGSLSEEKFAYDYQVMNALQPNQKNVLVSIAREESIDGYCRFLEHVKTLKTQHVTSHVLAIVTAFCALHPNMAFLHHPQVLLNLEEDTTAMAIVCNGAVLHTNALLFGSRNIRQNDALKLLNEEYVNTMARWRESLPQDTLVVPIKNIWVTGDEVYISQFFDLLCHCVPDANIQLFGLPGDLLPTPDTAFHTGLSVLFGLALLSLGETPIKVSLLPERQKWIEHTKKQFSYLAMGFCLLLFGLVACFTGMFFSINSKLRKAKIDALELQRCSTLIPEMNTIHNKMLTQQKRMLPIVEAAARTQHVLDALQQWQLAQQNAPDNERCWGIYLADEFTFDYANQKKKEEEKTRKQPAHNLTQRIGALIDELKPENSSEQPFNIPTTFVDNLPILKQIYIGGIVPLGKSRYKTIKDMQTHLVDSGFYVNVDDRMDFVNQPFQDAYFLPWRDFLTANADALQSDYDTFFLQLPFKDEFIISPLVPQTTADKR